MLLTALTSPAFALDFTDHDVIYNTTGSEVVRSVVFDMDTTTPPHGYFLFDVWDRSASQGTLYASRWDGSTFTARAPISTRLTIPDRNLISVAVRDADTAGDDFYVSALFTPAGTTLKALEEWVIDRASFATINSTIGDQQANAVTGTIARNGIAVAESLTHPLVGACYVANCEDPADPNCNDEDTFGKVRSDTDTDGWAPDTATADLRAVGQGRQEHCVTAFESQTTPPTQVVAWTDGRDLKIRTSAGDATLQAANDHNLEMPSVTVVTLSGGAEAVVVAWIDKYTDPYTNAHTYTFDAAYCIPDTTSCGSASNWTSGYGASLSWSVYKKKPQIAADPAGNLFVSYLDTNGSGDDRMMVRAFCNGSGWQAAMVVDDGTANKHQALAVKNDGSEPDYDPIPYGNIVYDGGTYNGNTGFVHVAYVRDDGVGGNLWKPIVATELVDNLCP